MASLHPYRERIKDGLVALGLANLALVSAWYPLLYGTEFAYFKEPVTHSSLFAVAANIAWITLAGWLVLRGYRGSQNRWFRLSCDLLIVILLLVPIDYCRRGLFHTPARDIIAVCKQPLVVAGLVLLAGLVIWKHRGAARGAAVLAGILSPLALITLGRIILVLAGVSALARIAQEPMHPPLNPTFGDKPRVLWLIFDETDYRLVFENRPAGLQLPELDRLRGESIFAANAFPPADGTIMSMPSLISGTRVTNAEPAGDSDLKLKLLDGRISRWSELPSVFAEARELGCNTALLGWFHCYDRVLHSGLNYCKWYSYPGTFPAQQPTFDSAMFDQVACIVQGLQNERLFATVYRGIISDAFRLATNSSYNLMLLHLPPPHLPGVYLPDKDKFTIFSMPMAEGYFNNMVLVDRTLGKLRAELEQSGQWEKTWVLLSSDHSWRRSQLYDGKRDLRVPFMLKPPGKPACLTLGKEINTVVTHDLILAILRGEVTNTASSVAWLEARASAEPLPQERSIDDFE